MSKKVYIIHGFEGAPNGGWRPWLMGELGSEDVYSCALPMPSPENPKQEEWVAEIARVALRDEAKDVVLVGHSLGVPAILRYMESVSNSVRLAGAVLVAGPYENIGKPRIGDFFKTPFDFPSIKRRAAHFAVVHAKNDANVPFAHAEVLARKLDAELYALETGAHLNGSSGVYQLPAALEAIRRALG